jgi:hypothetical protein
MRRLPIVRRRASAPPVGHPGHAREPGGGGRRRQPAEDRSRHLFDLGLGVDNLFHGSKAKAELRFSLVNLTNKDALYNFLSTFSGTHFVTPRAYQVQLGVSF